jgi:hypothetical protein
MDVRPGAIAAPDLARTRRIPAGGDDVVHGMLAGPAPGLWSGSNRGKLWERACERTRCDSTGKPIFLLTSSSVSLYSPAAGTIALAVAAAKSEEPVDEEARESLSCFRSACPARSPRPFSITQEAQLLSWVASPVGRHIPSSHVTRWRFPGDRCVFQAKHLGQAQPCQSATLSDETHTIARTLVDQGKAPHVDGSELGDVDNEHDYSLVAAGEPRDRMVYLMYQL